MQHRGLSKKVEDVTAASVLARIGRPALLYVVLSTISCLLLLEAWSSGFGRETRVTARATTAALLLPGAMLSNKQHSASSVQGVPLAGMPEYKFFWVGKSTIPGAGVGTFAKQDIPAGTLWNIEDSNPDSTLVISLPLWQSLLSLLKHLTAAGHSSHPLNKVYEYYLEYAYRSRTNSNCSSSFIAALTGSTFTNHAPEAPARTSNQQAAGAAAAATSSRTDHADSGPAAAAAPGMSQSTPRYANSADLTDKKRQVPGVTAWQICVISVTLRNITAGEEILEDYLEYSPPCQGVHRPDYITSSSQQQQQQQQQHYKAEAGVVPDSDWDRAVLVQSPDIYLGNSSSAGGGLGVFAARDLPAGTVWNKPDAAHALTVTRGQWARLVQLNAALKASGAQKPLFGQLIDVLGSHGICCPGDDRMYIPLTAAVLAKRGVLQGSPQQQQQGSSTGKQQLLARQQPANAIHVQRLHVAAATASPAAAGSDVHCTWLQTLGHVRKGEELVVGHSQQHTCDWPGMETHGHWR